MDLPWYHRSIAEACSLSPFETLLTSPPAIVNPTLPRPGAAVGSWRLSPWPHEGRKPGGELPVRCGVQLRLLGQALLAQPGLLAVAAHVAADFLANFADS
jgi:hypothetical protein